MTSGLLGLSAKISVADTGYSSLLNSNIALENYLTSLTITLSAANTSEAISADMTLI
jgi:hypothetical protein